MLSVMLSSVQSINSVDRIEENAHPEKDPCNHYFLDVAQVRLQCRENIATSFGPTPKQVAEHGNAHANCNARKDLLRKEGRMRCAATLD
jgi:hypothetical protein